MYNTIVNGMRTHAERYLSFMQKLGSFNSNNILVTLLYFAFIEYSSLFQFSNQ